MADTYDEPAARYDEDRAYERRDRSASPRGGRDEPARSRSPVDRDRAPPPPRDVRMHHSMEDEQEEEKAVNTGSNLFVTGISPVLNEEHIAALFSKYGEVESCHIMVDPHTKDPRGFGFVNMKSSSEADAAREGLQGKVHEGRTLSIEKARRHGPRTPTPGKYFGPPKKSDGRGPPRGGGYRDRYDDRRGGYGRRDDYRGGPPRNPDDYDRRGHGGGRRDRDDYGRGDRYEGGRRGDDGYYGGGRDGGYGGGGYSAPRERRGGGGGSGYGGGYDRDDRSYGAPRDEAPRDSYGSGGGRDYPPREERYGAR